MIKRICPGCGNEYEGDALMCEKCCTEVSNNNEKEEGKYYMDFGEAIEAMKDGFEVYRKGWHGIQLHRTMFIYIENGKFFKQDVLREPLASHDFGEGITVEPHINLVVEDREGKFHLISGWLASQTDVLAQDWDLLDYDE